jgi:uncharacterized YccA/Bax inhibitor family protein
MAMNKGSFFSGISICLSNINSREAGVGTIDLFRLLGVFVKIVGMLKVFRPSLFSAIFVTGMNSSLVWREQTAMQGACR